jgi:hypothetical protein
VFIRTSNYPSEEATEKKIDGDKLEVWYSQKFSIIHDLVGFRTLDQAKTRLRPVTVILTQLIEHQFSEVEGPHACYLTELFLPNSRRGGSGKRHS